MPILGRQTLVAGSLRSFPQDSWRHDSELCEAKRMIRGLGEIVSSTYSQTINVHEAHVASVNVGLESEPSSGPPLVSSDGDAG